MPENLAQFPAGVFCPDDVFLVHLPCVDAVTRRDLNSQRIVAHREVSVILLVIVIPRFASSAIIS